MNLVLPFINSILFRLGGWGKGDYFAPDFPFNKIPKWGGAKWIRWICIGGLVGVYYAIAHRSWIPLICIGTYLFATNAVNYGEDQIWRKWLGRDGCWLFYGFCFGLASAPVALWYSLIQAVVGAVSFWGLMKLSNDGIEQEPTGSSGLVEVWKLNHAYVELGIGFIGTAIYFFIK